jgi:molybdopterin molybdotransferase
MFTVAEALKAVLDQSHGKPPGQVELADALGLVLAEDVASDIDSPPHDKSMVDGYAVLAADLVDGRARLGILEEVTAGALPTRKVIPGFCTRIMTGAPLPEGADSIVMVERTTQENDFVSVHDDFFRRDQNVSRRGQSLRRGDVVLHAGAELGPAEIGLLAEVGRAKVQTIGPVSVAILSTGNELVSADQNPGPSQIRNSNGPLLMACTRRAGATGIDLGIARDERSELHRAIQNGLKHDILVVSGGVSAGVLDLVPTNLAELGVRQVFHKIQMKPGKPLWFGVLDRATHDSPLTPNPTLVFGLPGNPLSSLVCFELFVKPAIARIAGRHREAIHDTQTAKLTREFTHRGDRPTYHPAKMVSSPEGLLVETTAWHGSADLRGFAGANALAIFPAGDRCYQAGEVVNIIQI